MIDQSQISDIQAEELPQPDAPPANGKVPIPAIRLYLNPDLSVSWQVDDKQVKNLDAVIHCLRSALAAVECDRDTIRAIQMQQRLMQQAQEQAQVRSFAQGPSYKPRRH